MCHYSLTYWAFCLSTRPLRLNLAVGVVRDLDLGLELGFGLDISLSFGLDLGSSLGLGLWLDTSFRALPCLVLSASGARLIVHHP